MEGNAAARIGGLRSILLQEENAMTAVAELAVAEAINDDKEYEVVNGRKEPKMAGARHGEVCAQMIIELGLYLRQHKTGRIYTPDTTFLIGTNDRLPDIGFIASARIPPEGAPFSKWEIPPDLAVEIISPNDLYTNVKAKLGEYFAAGVREVWVVEPELMLITVYQSLTRDRILTADDELTSDLLPSFKCRVGELFQV
jgi:Uma2 family endonuclease